MALLPALGLALHSLDERRDAWLEGAVVVLGAALAVVLAGAALLSFGRSPGQDLRVPLGRFVSQLQSHQDAELRRHFPEELSHDDVAR